MTAADVIQTWSRSLQSNQVLQGIITATQAGAASQEGSVAAYSDVVLTRQGDGSLTTLDQPRMLFSDRRNYDQPFYEMKADANVFTLRLDGNMNIRSITWGGTQTISLQDLGHGLLSGWGLSIGNKTNPSLWVVAINPQPQLLPG